MSAIPYRLSEAEAGDGGRLIDRNRPVRFTFDGKPMSGFAGDTLASALLANGVRLVGRSFKYHRPRGILGLGFEEPNALVTIGKGARREPDLRATEVELFEGLVAESQNRWPSLKTDFSAINNRLSSLFPSGFYYKTFMGPGRGAWRLYEYVIRRAAGLGIAAREADPDIYEHVHVHCDVLVAGGGIAGICAARAAAAAGMRVIIAETAPQFGGRADAIAGRIDGGRAVEWVRREVEDLARSGNVHLLPRTTVAGLYDHNWVMMAERLGDHLPADHHAGMPRHRLWKVRAKEVVIATGAIERPLLFADNDVPGIMLASATHGYLKRYAVAPGRRGVVITNNDSAYVAAAALKDAGVEIAQLVDSRPNPTGFQIDVAKSSGIPMIFGSVLDAIASDRGMSVKSVQITGRAGGNRLSFDADFIAVSGGWTPAANLYCHLGGALVFDGKRQAMVPQQEIDAIAVVGAANGTFAIATAISEADDAGVQAATRIRGKAPPRRSAPALPEVGAQIEAPIDEQPLLRMPKPGEKHFVDFQNDVTVADLALALREGYASVEHIKRYTTLGMATDQGKTSNVNALAVIAEIQQKAADAVGLTRFRPPFSPVSFGAIVGSRQKELFLPVRKTAMSDWHGANGAVFEPVGQWRRPYCYPRAGESEHDAVNREVLAVREAAGIIDVSTLGKIELRGRDAAAFLDLMYATPLASLAVGRCRYALMCDDQGILIDDGVVLRLADDHFLVHTTSGNSDRIAAHFENWHQTEWPQMSVFITPVTEQWAQITIAGPNSRAILQRLKPSVDLSAAALKHMSFVIGEIAGVPARIMRVSYSGEMSFEIAVPASSGLRLWQALLDAGAEDGLTPYGTEALHVLRAEKGLIALGEESDGTVTPLDLGLAFAVSKKKADFVGKRSMALPALSAADRKQLVGLLTEDAAEVLPDGAQIIEKDTFGTDKARSIGHVTSPYWSPTLKRSIALALLSNGRARMGDVLDIAIDKRAARVSVVSPVFYDPEGARQNG